MAWDRQPGPPELDMQIGPGQNTRARLWEKNGARNRMGLRENITFKPTGE